MFDNLFRRAAGQSAIKLRKDSRTASSTAIASPAIAAVSIALGIVISGFVMAGPVHAGSGQQSAPQTPPPQAQSQQPSTAPADEGTFGSAPGTTSTTPTVAPWMTVPPTDYHKHVASKYNYAFGKETPFLPSKATSYNGEFMSPKDFPTAQY